MNYLVEKSDNKQQSHVEITSHLMLNMIFKGCLISFCVSMASKPFQTLLIQKKAPLFSIWSAGFFRGAYRGIGTHVIAGQQRGLVNQMSTQVNNNLNREIEDTKINQLKLILLFSQIDLILCNGFYGKSILQQAEIINRTFKWTPSNWAKLTFLNWGSRSLTNLIKFSALGIMGDYMCSAYHFNRELYNKLAGGATTGLIVSLLTTLPNTYGDHKLLHSTINKNDRLEIIKTYTMFQQIKSHIHSSGLKKAIYECGIMSFKDWQIRGPMSSVIFSIIFGMDHLLDPLPIDFEKSQQKSTEKDCL